MAGCSDQAGRGHWAIEGVGQAFTGIIINGTDERTNEQINKQTFLDLILRQEESSRLATFGNYSLLLVPKRFFRNLVQHYRESKLELVASCCISLITLILQSRKFAHGKFESIVILELSL